MILGAGASKPYGFPTGRELLFLICNDLKNESSDSFMILIKLNFNKKEIRAFEQSLRNSMMPSVDAFLENRPEFMQIGKAAIACALIPFENQEVLLRNSKKLFWYEHLYNHMDTRKEEFDKNQLSITTFNYDRSLEYFFLIALTNSYGINIVEAVKLLKTIDIVHVYGQLGKLDHLNKNGRRYSHRLGTKAVQKSISEIKILPEHSGESDEFEKAYKLLRKASTICFLGFGYHPINVERLQINNLPTGKRCFGTAFGLYKAEQRRIQGLLQIDATLGTSEEGVLEFLRAYPIFN